MHQGYARYRTALLRMGTALYELMPGASERRGDDTKAGSYGSSGSLGRLHAKLAVVDQRRLYIGSMNMDRRSAHSNTEMGLVIESEALAAEVASLLRRERLPRSYQLRIAATSGRIEWVAGAPGAEVVHASEPQGDPLRALRLWATTALVGEELL